jgi:predicted dehydrogenase
VPVRVLAGGEWTDGFLDAHRGESEYRLKVLAWRNLERLDELYFVRPRSVRLVVNYVREVGVPAVLRKVASRTGERFRNEKYVSLGVGEVLEAGSDGAFAVGARVCFLAPLHPACMERVVVPAALLAPFEGTAGAAGGVAHLALRGAPAERWWTGLEGWSAEAGVALDDPRVAPVRARLQAEAGATDWARAHMLPLPDPSPVAERRGQPPAPRAGRPRAVLFGLGNYAKTLVLPNVRPFLDVVAAHEIDPTQIPRAGGAVPCWDTAPAPRADEAFDVLLIAGYHHSHAPLAVEALRRGAWAVTEKPVVVNEAQRAELLRAVAEHGERFFSCFHKRYLPFNDDARADLGVGAGEAVHYHCIVYEVPMPRLHWYLWPNSRSRLTSNGCHWIDHFLFLNEYAAVRRSDLFVAGDGTLNVSLELENGAVFTMILTEQGSERIGVQEHVELRARGRTVRMVNGGLYVAEGPDRMLRRRRINKMESYTRMYRTIGHAVAEGRPGDSLRSIEVSTGAVLGLEDLLRGALRGAAAAPARRSALQGSTAPSIS